VLNGADSFPLMAVPFFLLAGEVMNTGGLSKRIVNLAMALVGHVRGGLGFVAIFAACVLSSLSGSAVADAAALGALLYPMMIKSGHDPARDRRAAGIGFGHRADHPAFDRLHPLSASSAASRSPSSSSPASFPAC
jgi:TRAP-type C4-dicarboxylate transport system permease large subunit